MTDVRDLYQEVILDHGKNPRNRTRPEGANREAVGHNPLCGDRVTVYARVEDGIVADLGFEGNGCAISTASASMMTQALKGKPIEEVARVFERFHAMVAGDQPESPEELGKLNVFAGVRAFPIRVKCATLVWHTLRAALERPGETVTTE